MRQVFLQFAPNAAYCQVVEKTPAGVTIDADGSTWRFEKRQYKIGESRYIEQGRKRGVIGVYDADNIEHLDHMVHAALESQREHDIFA